MPVTGASGPRPSGENRAARSVLQRLRYLPHRGVGAAWFGVWGTVTAAALFFEPALVHGWATVALYVFLPGIAAAVAGLAVGPGVLDTDGGAAKGAALGLAAVILAHLLFAPAFAGGLWLADGWFAEPGHVNPFGMTLATLSAGFLMAAPLTLPVGALAGGLLALLWRALPSEERKEAPKA